MTALSTPADLLREAARLMRERAETATPGTWTSQDEYVQSTDQDGETRFVAETFGLADKWPNANHFASWHPAVALTVADLLDAEATWAQDRPPTPEGFGYPEDSKCLRIARAYLGVTP